MKKYHLLVGLSLGLLMSCFSMQRAEALTLSNPAPELTLMKCDTSGRCADGSKASCAVAGGYTECSSGGIKGPTCVVAASRAAYLKGEGQEITPCSSS